MAQIFLNNCYATIAQPITTEDTTIRLVDMNGFPASVGDGDFFLLTLFSDSSRYGENIEVVNVTGLSGTTVTVERGFEGEALAHDANERVEARLTAETLRNLTPTWDQVSDKPTEFSPESHTHSATNITSGTLSGSRLPNASRTTTGGVRVRLNGTTAYITNNGRYA